MPGNTTKSTAVKNRLKKTLTKDDRWGATRSTVDHIVNQGLKKEDINSTDEFLRCIVPGIATYNPDWAGIKALKDLKNSEVQNGLRQHMRNLKKKESKIQDHIDAEIRLRDDITDSEESEKESQKSDNISVSAISKTDQKGQNDPKQLQGVAPFSIADEEAEEPEQDAGAQPNLADLFTIEKKYTAKQIALIDNSIETDSIISEMRMCKGKWKALTKRLEKLKKLNQAHTFNLYADSD